MTRQRQQVRGEDRRPRVGRETLAATAPGAASKSEAALEEGDAALDASTEPAQPSKDPARANHLVEFDAEVLGEGDVGDAARFDLGNVVLRREPAVEGYLARSATYDFRDAFNQAKVESVGLPLSITQSKTSEERPTVKQSLWP